MPPLELYANSLRRPAPHYALGLRDLWLALFKRVDLPSLQVINAALTLAARPQSKVAQDNMDVFKDQWEKQVRILTEAVDDITSVDDFLSVSGKWNYV